MSIKRIGFACKWIDNLTQINGAKPTDDCKQYTTGSTTVAWLKRQTKDVAEQKLWDLMVQNIESIQKLVSRVSKLEPSLRMVRLGSDILPVYTHLDWNYFWKRPDVVAYAVTHFAIIGAIAREHAVRLSFHPGQFCCVVSENPNIVARSLEELEYHAAMVQMMGFGLSKLDFKINVHLSGKLGVDGFDTAWHQMSPVLRNCLTLENDEYQASLDVLIKLKHRVGIVLDIHHHFINSDEYITAIDPRIEQIVESWQGQRPTIHYSQSKDEFISMFANTMPLKSDLLIIANCSKLRSHSVGYSHTMLNNWALTHLSWANIMCESKSKNIGSFDLHSQARIKGIV